MKKIILFLSILVIPLGHLSSHPLDAIKGAEELLKTMSLDEKVGSLFIVGAYSTTEDALFEGQNEEPHAYVDRMIQKEHAGGVLFKMRWDPVGLHAYIRELQKQVSLPLLTMQDLEWGLNQRHATALRFPRNMTLGAIQDDDLIYELGREIGREALLVGINCNLAPCSDVNSNPQNPIIGDRSFGDSPVRVAKKALLLARGLQDSGIAACAKHFPGHGDTVSDPHSHLPTISRSREEIESCELVPFRSLAKDVMMVMTAHIVVPSLEPKEGLPATFSQNITRDLLKKELGFSGLVISDDLLMKAISERATPEEAALRTFRAGCDLILSSRDIEREAAAIKNAIQNGTILEGEVDAKVLKILKLKLWIKQQKAIAPETIDEALLFPEKAKALKRTLYRKAITLKNRFRLREPTVILQIGGPRSTPFSNFLHYPVVYLAPNPSEKELEEAREALEPAKSILITFFDMNPKSGAWGVGTCRKGPDTWTLKKPILDFLGALRGGRKLYGFVTFVSPYIKQFLREDDPICFAFEDDPDAQKAAAFVILGDIKAEGVLPIR
jgi:beta-glucosidase-like glycosyl hydrolase